MQLKEIAVAAAIIILIVGSGALLMFSIDSKTRESVMQVMSGMSGSGTPEQEAITTTTTTMMAVKTKVAWRDAGFSSLDAEVADKAVPDVKMWQWDKSEFLQVKVQSAGSSVQTGHSGDMVCGGNKVCEGYFFNSTVKWSIDGTDIDPYWLGTEKETLAYTYDTMTSCRGKTCVLTLGGSYAFDVDKTWKPIDQAFSLKNSSVQCNVVSDGKDIAECLDWNTTYITVNLTYKNALSLSSVPLKVYTPNATKNELAANGTIALTGDYKKDYALKSNANVSFLSKSDVKSQTLAFGLRDILEFGTNSTNIMLNESNGGNVGDAQVISISSPNRNYGASISGLIGKNPGGNIRVWSLWNLAALPGGAIITNANLSFYVVGITGSVKTTAFNSSLYNVTGAGPWVEGNQDGGTTSGDGTLLTHNITWDNQPIANKSQSSNTSVIQLKNWAYWNVTNASVSTFSQAIKNMSILINGSEVATNTITLNTKENTTVGCTACYRPQLNITYIPGAGDTTPPTFQYNNTNNTNPLPLNQVLYYANWTDDVALDTYIFSWNATGALCTGGFANDSDVKFSGGTWSNITKQAPAACAGKVIDFEIFANDTSNNWNVTNMTQTEQSSSTCTYGGSGDWNVDCAEGCTISADTNIGTNTLIFSGIGYIYMNANLAAGSIVPGDGCKIVVADGKTIALKYP